MAAEAGLTAAERLPALDGLRGVAILLVILTHVGGGWQREFLPVGSPHPIPSPELPYWLSMVCQRAALGVMLFFVVSAFTLTMQSGRRRDGWGAYAIRRVARVGPAFWLAAVGYTLVFATVSRVLAPDGLSPADVLATIGFGSAWVGAGSLAVVPGGWSVSCEVAFYAVLPLLLWLIDGRISRAVVLTGLATIGVQLAGRYAIRHDMMGTMFGISPIVQAPVFLCGITAAVAARRVTLPRVPGLVAVLLVLTILGLPLVPIDKYLLLPPLAFAGVALLLVLFAAQQPPWLLTNPVLRALGTVSYSMYLVHFAIMLPAYRLVEAVMPANDWRRLAVHMVVTTGATFALAAVTYRWVERPGMAFGRALIARLGR